MGHGGSPTATLLGANCVHIDGTLFLPAGESFVIGLFGSGAEFELPEGFAPEPRAGIPLSKLVRVYWVFTGPGGANEPPHVHIEKADAPFTITVVNDSVVKSTAALELYVQYMHSLIC